MYDPLPARCGAPSDDVRARPKSMFANTRGVFPGERHLRLLDRLLGRRRLVAQMRSGSTTGGRKDPQ
jgi:hypothetical protein